MKTVKCSTCKGTGILPQYKHIHNGRCFQCNGKGETKQTGNTKRLEILEQKFIQIESEYKAAKKEIENAMNDFSTGKINPFQLADICGKYELNKLEKQYHEWINHIENEKKLLAK